MSNHNYTSIDGQNFRKQQMDGILPRTEQAVEGYRSSTSRVVDPKRAAKIALLLKNASK